MSVMTTLDLLGHVTDVCSDGKDSVVILVLMGGLKRTAVIVIPILDLLDYVTPA